ncbi:hypothetical protein [Streptomyces griseus]|uniref:hypothetical protein n=2 Tax=Streptomyces griseus TaxID=1911 RepID=UPI0004CC5489|nr:hypothetical protein [Streptomyces griseus]
MIPGNFLSATTEAVDPNTSGWAAKLNCTISLGTGGRNGDGTLKLTSTASGEMQARTASSYDVVVGVTYAAFCDASGTTVPERIGIRWLTSTGTEVSVTWGLTTATASATWHRISVGGVAPMGAARAQVLVSASPAAGAVVSNFENVYFGWPLRFAGNLFSFNTEQAEIDATGWAVESNGTLSRTVPMFSWPVDWYYSGGQVTTLTVTANGNASALSVERPPVTPGMEYVGYAYLNPPTSGSACWVELRFYDAGGSQIQATRSTLAAPSTGTYRQIASAVAPAAAATASLAFGITGATAAQILRSEGAVIKARTATITSAAPNSNVVTFADSEFEQGVGQWTVASGVATVARSTPWAAQSISNGYSLTVTSSTPTASTVRSGKYPVTELLPWRPSVALKRVAGSWTLTSISVRWFDATDSLITTTTSSAVAIPSDGAWWSYSADTTAPAAAATAQIDVVLAAGATSSTLQVDLVRLTQVLPAIEVESDDSTASISLIARELVTSRTMTVYRIGPDGSRTVVRGRAGLLENVPITDETLSVEDYEAPLGVPVSYRLEFLNGTTGKYAGAYTSLRATIAVGDRNYSWLKDPARPQLNLRVLVKQAPDWTQPIEQNAMRIRGRQNALVLSGQRGGREGSLVVWTQTDSEREALRRLLASGATLLWQSAPDVGEPDVYVSVGSTAAPRVSSFAPESWREWTLPLTEQDRPTTGLAGSATWTVQDVLVENESVLSLISRYATVLDLALDQRSS